MKFNTRDTIYNFWNRDGFDFLLYGPAGTNEIMCKVYSGLVPKPNEEVICSLE